MASKGPAKTPMAVFPNCKIPSKLVVITAKPTVIKPMKVAIALVRKTWRPSLILTEHEQGLTRSSQTTAAKEFNPDDKVLK